MAGGYSQRDSGQDHSADNEALAAARKLRSRDAGGIRLSEADKLRIAEASLQASEQAAARDRRDPVAEAQKMARMQEVSRRAEQVADEVAAQSAPEAGRNADASRRTERTGGERVMIKPGSEQHTELQNMVALGGNDKPAADSGDWTQQYMGRPAGETVATPPAEGNWLQRQLAKLKPKKAE